MTGVDLLVDMVTMAMNRHNTRSGYSLAQRSSGENVRVPASLLSENVLDRRCWRRVPPRSSIGRLRYASPPRRRCCMRRMPLRSRARRGRSRASCHDLLDGEVVFLWQRVATTMPGGWVEFKMGGPGLAIVVIVSASKVAGFAHMCGVAFNCAISQLRPARNQEPLSAELIKDYLPVFCDEMGYCTSATASGKPVPKATRRKSMRLTTRSPGMAAHRHGTRNRHCRCRRTARAAKRCTDVAAGELHPPFAVPVTLPTCLLPSAAELSQLVCSTTCRRSRTSRLELGGRAADPDRARSSRDTGPPVHTSRCAKSTAYSSRHSTMRSMQRAVRFGWRGVLGQRLELLHPKGADGRLAMQEHHA